MSSALYVYSWTLLIQTQLVQNSDKSHYFVLKIFLGFVLQLFAVSSFELPPFHTIYHKTSKTQTLRTLACENSCPSSLPGHVLFCKRDVSYLLPKISH